MDRRQIFAAFAMLVALAVPFEPALAQPAKSDPTAASTAASHDDTAKFLAGLAPAKGSPLEALTRDDAWAQHSRTHGGEWSKLDAGQLAKVRAFSAKHQTADQKTLFYFFSGPDFLYADAFFPKATTYVLAGLEGVGPIPDVSKVRKGNLGPTLAHLRTAMNHLMGRSYFITLDMGKHLSQGQLPGTIPVLYVFLARTGKTVKDVQHVRLQADGTVVPYQHSGDPKDRPRAVKITFAGGDNVERTLYYFATNLENKGIAESGFLTFCKTLAPGDGFVKSASYLLHGGNFSTVREFLLANSRSILQDDTGPPLSFYKEDQWRLQPYGKYTRPIPVFRHNYQSKMRDLFDKGNPPPFDFSLGYNWRPGQSNLVHAFRK